MAPNKIDWSKTDWQTELREGELSPELRLAHWGTDVRKSIITLPFALLVKELKALNFSAYITEDEPSLHVIMEQQHKGEFQFIAQPGPMYFVTTYVPRVDGETNTLIRKEEQKIEISTTEPDFGSTAERICEAFVEAFNKFRAGYIA